MDLSLRVWARRSGAVLARRAERVNATLFLPGVICVLAGGVGGGLTAAGVAVPVLRTWGGQVAFVGLGLVLVVLSFFLGVGPAPDRWVRPERGFAGPGPFLGHVPLPPKHFVPRPAELGCIRAAVLPPGQRVGVVGMGGAGKSALAAAVVHDRAVAKRFQDGIAWIDVGGDRSAAQVQQLRQQLAVLLGDRKGAFTTVGQWRDHLAWLLADRSCLVILDNVWDRAVLDAFDVPRRNSTILFTSRDHRLVEAAGAVECNVDRLDGNQARVLVSAVDGI